jgi:hypothetical protein
MRGAGIQIMSIAECTQALLEPIQSIAKQQNGRTRRHKQTRKASAGASGNNSGHHGGAGGSFSQSSRSEASHSGKSELVLNTDMTHSTNHSPAVVVAAAGGGGGGHTHHKPHAVATDHSPTLTDHHTRSMSPAASKHGLVSAKRSLNRKMTQSMDSKYDWAAMIDGRPGAEVNTEGAGLVGVEGVAVGWENASIGVSEGSTDDLEMFADNFQEN